MAAVACTRDMAAGARLICAFARLAHVPDAYGAAICKGAGCLRAWKDGARRLRNSIACDRPGSAARCVKPLTVCRALRLAEWMPARRS